MEVVWPRTCAGWSQIHTKWTISCETKLDLIQEMESWVRKHIARCERNLIKLGYHCPRCQHGLCTACNEIEGHIQCPWCLEPFPIMPHGHQQPAHNHVRTTQCLNLHALGEQWIEEVKDVDIVQTPPEDVRRENISNSKPTLEGGRQGLGRIAAQNCWEKLTTTYDKHF